MKLFHKSPNSDFSHKYIKFLDFIIDKESTYRLGPAFQYSKLTESEFNLIKDSIFYTENLPDSYSTRSQYLDWKIKPEALFGYLSYKQYEHAIVSSKRAFWISVGSLAIAVLSLALSA
ncbi:MAG: hypothetical protein AB2660_01340 [Candidatus Thiodiazotropha sp.]